MRPSAKLPVGWEITLNIERSREEMMRCIFKWGADMQGGCAGMEPTSSCAKAPLIYSRAVAIFISTSIGIIDNPVTRWPTT